MKEKFEKEFEDVSPFLADLKKQQKQEPFKTPRLYFDTLTDKVIEKAQENPAIVPPQYNQRPSLSSRLNGWLSTILQPRLALAACGLALVAVAGLYIVNQQKTIVLTTTNPSVATTETTKNNATDSVIGSNTTIEKQKQQPSTIGQIVSKIEEQKAEVADNQAIPKTPSVLKPAGITHPKSGLTEEEIEEFLKDALVDEDIEDIGGKL